MANLNMNDMDMPRLIKLKRENSDEYEKEMQAFKEVLKDLAEIANEIIG